MPHKIPRIRDNAPFMTHKEKGPPSGPLMFWERALVPPQAICGYEPHWGPSPARYKVMLDLLPETGKA